MGHLQPAIIKVDGSRHCQRFHHNI
jgi:hypothetical protein